MNGTIASALVVVGAASAVGRGVVRAAVEAGIPVIAVDRDTGALQRLRNESAEPLMTLVSGAVDDDESAAALAARLHAVGSPLLGIALALPAIAERGRILDLPAAQLRDAFDSALLPYLTAARHFLPLLANSDRGAGLILVGGPGGEQPWAGYGHRSIVAAALRMLASVLHEEARSLHVRVQLLAPDKPLRSECGREDACTHWPTALDVGRRVLELLRREQCTEATRAVVDYPAPEAVATQAESTSTPWLSHASAGTDAAPHSAKCLKDARSLLRSLMPSRRIQES